MTVVLSLSSVIVIAGVGGVQSHRPSFTKKHLKMCVTPCCSTVTFCGGCGSGLKAWLQNILVAVVVVVVVVVSDFFSITQSSRISVVAVVVVVVAVVNSL